MLCFARQTVDVAADCAVKHVDLVFVDAPASAVRRSAVETFGLARLGFLNAQQ